MAEILPPHAVVFLPSFFIILFLYGILHLNAVGSPEGVSLELNDFEHGDF
jgi:hypothetical protein